MLTQPTIVTRAAQPYVAINRAVTIPFDETANRLIAELQAQMKADGIVAAGPVIFKHNTVAMPEVDMDFGVIVARPVMPRGRMVTGVLPAGRYGQLSHFGDYDGLIDANGALIEWAKQSGIAWDMSTGPNGDTFASRLEIYPNGPHDEPDPAKWETIVAIKIRD